MQNYFYIISILVTHYFCAIFSMKNCPKFQLIQPLDEAIGLSYAMIAGGKYFIITDNDVDDDNNTVMDPIGDMPEGFEEPYGIMLYDKRDCSPPQYNLMAYRFDFDEQNRAYDRVIKLDLINWNASKKWSKIETFLPDYLNGDSFMNEFPLTSTFYWHQKRSIFIIQFPVKSAPLERFRNMYHTIKISNSCPPKYNYFEDYQMNVKEVFKPFDNFDSCLVLNDSKILCVGTKGISSYHIDFDKTKDGHLRVKPSETVQQFPILAKICNWFSPITPTTTSSNTTIDFHYEEQTDDEESNFILWVFIITLFILMLSTIAFVLWLKNKLKKKENEDYIQRLIGIRTASNTSNISMRSGINDLDNTKEGKGLAGYGSSTSQISMRSQVYDKNKDKQLNETKILANESNIGSQPSTRSQTNTDNNRSPPKVLPNASSIGSEVSIRSQMQKNQKIAIFKS